MPLDAFVNFDGNCREALAFYAKIFGVEKPYTMTYGEMPPGPEGLECPGGVPLPPEAKNLLCYANLPIDGNNLMLCDVPPGAPFIAGNNITLTYSTKDMAEIRRLFAALKEGGNVIMDLQKTFWSELFGMLTDKFGVNWQFVHDSGTM